MCRLLLQANLRKKLLKKLFRQLAKEPFGAKKRNTRFCSESPQGAFLTEAFNLVKEGICSAQEIDKAISEGLGLRWSFMGPFQTIHLNAPEGIAGYVERYEKMYQGMFEKLKIEWSSVIKLGLEQELLKLYDLGERENMRKIEIGLQNLF